MNVIHQIVETVSIASMCQHRPHWKFFIFYLLKYNNSYSSTGECVWINGEQNSQRQESVQQHWPPTPQSESRQLAVNRSRTTLKFWSATMFGAAARNFGPVHKFELPTVIADSVPRATRVFSLASVGHVTGHMVSHMVQMARCRPPYWKIFTVNNLATVF